MGTSFAIMCFLLSIMGAETTPKLWPKKTYKLKETRVNAENRSEIYFRNILNEDETEYWQRKEG